MTKAWLVVMCRTDNAAKNRWAVISKRQPKHRQPVSTTSSLSTASVRTGHSALHSAQADTASALQATLPATDGTVTQTSARATSLTASPLTTNSKQCKTAAHQLPVSHQQGRCCKQDTSHSQPDDTAAATVIAGPSSRRLAYMASMCSTNSRHDSTPPALPTKPATPSPASPVHMTVSIDSSRLLPGCNSQLPSCGVLQQASVMQIESYCPAYQPKAVMWQSASPVQAAALCRGQDPSASRHSKLQVPLQGQNGEAHQGCAEEICQRGLTMALLPVASGSEDAVPASEATAHVHAQAPLQGQDPAVVQGFSQLPLWAPASMTTDAATCFAYLAGVLDERRRGKDATVQVHIDTAWKQLQMMLAGWLSCLSCLQAHECSWAVLTILGCAVG